MLKGSNEVKHADWIKVVELMKNRVLLEQENRTGRHITGKEQSGE